MDSKHWNGEPERDHDPNAGGDGVPYICTDCLWAGRGGVKALEHHVSTGHAVRGRRWPTDWPNAQFLGVERRKVQRTA